MSSLSGIKVVTVMVGWNTTRRELEHTMARWIVMIGSGLESQWLVGMGISHADMVSQSDYMSISGGNKMSDIVFVIWNTMTTHILIL